VNITEPSDSAGACGAKSAAELDSAIPIPVLQAGQRKLSTAASDVRNRAPSGAGRAASGPIAGENGKVQQLVDQRQAVSCTAVTAQNMHHKGGSSHTRLSENEARKWLLVKEKKDFTRFR
jgi:hypothetical protein